MGATKIQTQSTTTPTPTAEETELNKLQLQQYKETEPYQTQMQKSAYGLGNQLLSSFGGQNSDMWQSLIGGINEKQTQSMVQSGLRDVYPQFQQSGIMDSGVAASMSGRMASDIRNQNAQFNVGALQNALNLALSGQAQVQSPTQGVTSTLGTRLAGLRSNQTDANQRNPFNGLNLGIFGNWGGSNYSCWVAAEVFEGGWEDERTHMARYYINELAPRWFKRFYLKYGERIAKFIHNKPVFKMMLKPLFDSFVNKTRRILWVYGLC